VHAAPPQCAHGTLEKLTALPQRSRSALFNTLCKRQAAAFIWSMLKTNAAAWRSRRLHSAHTARTQPWWRLHSAHLGDLEFLERCGNAVRTPLWCDRGLSLKVQGAVSVPRYTTAHDKMYELRLRISGKTTYSICLMW